MKTWNSAVLVTFSYLFRGWAAQYVVSCWVYIFSTSASQQMWIMAAYRSKSFCCLWGKAICPGWEWTRNVTPESRSSFFGNSAALPHQKRPKSLNQFWPHDPEKYLCILPKGGGGLTYYGGEIQRKMQRVLVYLFIFQLKLKSYQNKGILLLYLLRSRLLFLSFWFVFLFVWLKSLCSAG